MTRCMHVKYSICNKSNSVESSKLEFLWAKGFILNYREVDIKNIILQNDYHRLFSLSSNF